MVGQIYRHHIRPIPCIVFIIKFMELYVRMCDYCPYDNDSL